QLRCDTSSARSPAHTVSDLFPSHPLPPATYTLSLHDALPISGDGFEVARADLAQRGPGDFFGRRQHGLPALHVADLAADLALMQDRKSTRLNSSHVSISYAVFCLKKKIHTKMLDIERMVGSP